MKTVTVERSQLEKWLDVLEQERDIYIDFGDGDGAPKHILDAITEIKEVLAQPEQDPVQTTQTSIVFYNGNSPLEESEVLRITKDGITVNPAFKPDEAAAAVLRALDSQIKEALAQPAQQPCDMGEMCIGCSPRNADGSCPGTKLNGACDCYVNGFNDGMKEMDGMGPYELRPAQRTWVGLTDEKIEEIAAKTLFPVPFARAIEAELKE